MLSRDREGLGPRGRPAQSHGSAAVWPACKRLLDVSLAALLLLVLAPVFLAVAAAVAMDGGPVFYRHARIGLGGRRFGCLKFRTMVPNADAVLAELLRTNPEARTTWEAQRKLPTDLRVTRVGRTLRCTSLDELPQLLNVLRGEMSLVGPRPVVQEELEQHYARLGAAAAYLSVRPGLTGLWQVSGRSDTSYEARIRLDLDYVADQSLATDLRILLRTPAAVLGRRGAM